MKRKAIASRKEMEGRGKGKGREGGHQSAHRRLPGTKMNRQQTAASTRMNKPSIVADRAFKVLRTNGSRIRLKSNSVYSL